MSGLGSIFGLIEDSPDARDKPFYLASEVQTVAGETDLSAQLPPAYDQGQLGTCACQATAGMVQYLFPGERPSVLQLYWEARIAGGYPTSKDGGSQIRDAMKVLQKTGLMPESAWPYVESNFDDPPPQYAGPRMTIANYSRINSVDDALKCLTLGHPFVLSIDLPDYFDNVAGSLGVLPNPVGRNEHIGLHAMLGVGHDTNFRSSNVYTHAIEQGVSPEVLDDDVAFLVRNSWSTFWGLQDAKEHEGHFWLPAKWLSNRSLVGDCWTGFREFTTSSAPEGSTVAGVPVKGHFT